MKPWLERLREFFFPPREAGTARLILPYAVLGVLTLIVFVAGTYAWDYTNSPDFCGTSCHTMPPEYTSYLVSPHARVQCVECHIGRGFFATRFTRKAGDIRHIIAMTFQTYEFPIRAHTLRPARDTCERCHFPEKFSDDSLREIIHYGDDIDNTPRSIYLTLKTGGGSEREGLGRGIHWHVENEVFYLTDDPAEQVIPYVMVRDNEGSQEEFIDITADLDPESIDPEALQRMDCITCHNRITHLVYHPSDSIDQLMARDVISPSIPGIKAKGVEVLLREYPSKAEALARIGAVENYYQILYPDFYASNTDVVQRAVQALQDIYDQSVFPEQNSDWDTHPNNVGHSESPGCFRCHDGQHLNDSGEAIRLECNLCHSIPVVAGPTDFVAAIEISRGPEPESHLNANWITLHRDAYNATCGNCHTVEDPGGVSNTSFCSNSACHGLAWEYAGFDAPGLREALAAQLPATPTPHPTPSEAQPLTYTDVVRPILVTGCSECHGEGGIQGFDVTRYETLMEGGESGPAVQPGDAEASLIVQKQTGEIAHFGQLSLSDLNLLFDWIEAGAPQD